MKYRQQIIEYLRKMGKKDREERNETKGEKKNGHKLKFEYFLIGIAIIGIIIVGLFIPTTVTVPYQRLENYTEYIIIQETYEVQVPYEDIEYYTEKEPFADIRYIQKDLIYKIDLIECRDNYHGWFTNYPAAVTYRIMNLDSEGGTFNLWIGFVLGDVNKVGKEISKYIYPSLSEDFTYELDVDITRCSYSLNTIPTKTIREPFTNYRDIKKSRPVIKWRTETRTKDVIKEHPAQRNVTGYTQKTVYLYQKILGWY